MSISPTRQVWLSALVCLALVGCGKEDTGPTPEDLVRRQQLRESSLLSKSKTSEERLAAAEQYLSSGNIIAAQKELRPLLISRPDDPQVLLLEAKCKAATGDKLAAAEMLDSIPETDAPSHTEALLLAADWLTEANEYDAAQQKLERILELHGDTSRLHRQLATLLNNQGRRIEAARHLRWLARSGEITEKELFAMNTYGDPFIDVSMPKPDFNEKLMPAALVEAKRIRADGDLEKARVLIESLSEAFPKSTPIAAFQGRVYADLQLDEPLRRWITITPAGIEREPEYWYALGSWMQRQGRHREAVRCFGEAVTRDETDRFSYLALARSLMLLGRNDEADRINQRFNLLAEAASIARELGLKPGTPEKLNRMAEILERLDRPWEAIAWRAVALETGGGGGEQERQDLHEQRDLLAARQSSATTDHPNTCGIDLADWPLPSLQEIDIRRAPDPIPGASESLSVGPIELDNVAADVGLAFQYDNGDDPSDDAQLLHQLTGGGIGVIDFDLDGWADLYMTQGGGAAYDPDASQPNQLFRNLGGRQWSVVTDPTGTGDRGYGQGVAAADINQDGFPDLVVANIGPNVLYWNNGDGTFRLQPLSPSGEPGDWTTSIACGDLSGDQLPEIVEINYIDDPSALTIACTPRREDCNPSVFRPASDHVWQVGTDGLLTTWNGCSEIASKPNYGFAGVIADFDGKYGNDLFIANDTEHNHYWLGQAADGSGSYSLLESAQLHGCAFGLLGQRQGCMGIAYGDFDRNGTLDLHITNFWNQAADLYMQDSTGLFANANATRGLYEPTRLTVGWGTQAVDFDRNGWLDLAVLNGHLADQRHRGRPYEMKPQLFRGDAEGFELVRPTAMKDRYWSTPTLGRTMAVLDWNGDSKPDLVTNHLDVPAALLENRTRAANSVQIELVGVASERDATGAKVTLTCGDQAWTEWVAGGDGLLCSNEQVLDFGIGAAESIDRLEVHWPSGATQRFSDLETNHRYLIVEGDDEVFTRKLVRDRP